MKVTTSFGYVEIKNYIPRKVDIAYSSILFANMDTSKVMAVAEKTLDKNQDQEKVEKEATKTINLAQLMEAGQARAYEMILKIVNVKEDKTEEVVEKTQEWWDECDRNDAKLIEAAVSEVAKEKSEEVKK